MNTPDLLSVCISSFLSVFVILSGLAIFMYLIIRLFPFKNQENDTAITAAITSVYSTVFPGNKIIKIEDKK
jgi:hypothetical protein